MADDYVYFNEADGCYKQGAYPEPLHNAIRGLSDLVGYYADQCGMVEARLLQYEVCSDLRTSMIGYILRRVGADRKAKKEEQQ